MSNWNTAHTPWHWVRCCDLHNKKLMWVEPTTNFVADAVTIAAHGRFTSSRSNPISNFK